MSASPSSSGWRRKACVACTASKRQCDKQTPTCRRCQDRGITCQYPMVRRVCAPMGGTVEQSDPVLPIGKAAAGRRPPGFDLGAPLLLDQDDELPPPPELVSLGCEWFLSEPSWAVVYCPPPGEPLDGDILHHFVGDVQRWLRQWVTDGRNPFIHAQLYRQRMPRSIRDAYTSLTAYYAKNDNNARLTMQVVEDNAAALLQDQQQDPLTDTIDHIARVQALLVYQTIRLFDGDIAARAKGEAALATTVDWAQQMWATAQRDLAAGEHGRTAAALRALAEGDCAAFVWRTWIVAESVRRTRLTALVLTVVYRILKTGSVECPGGIFFTARRGLWDAQSAYAWSRTGSVPLLQNINTADGLFDAVRADEVDEFSHVMMRCTYGPEKMERWAGDSAVDAVVNPLDGLFLIDDQAPI